jgi:hypothetical protein
VDFLITTLLLRAILLAKSCTGERHDIRGNLDPNFMGTDIVVTPVQYGAEAHALVIQLDGKIILGGTSIGNRYGQYTLVHYNNE